MKKRCRQSGKVKYDTPERALCRGGKVMATVPDLRNVKRFYTYKCPWCGHWHLTKKEPR